MILQSFLNEEGTINDAFTKVVPQNRKVTYFGMLATLDRINDINQKHNNYQISTIFSEQHYDRSGNLQLQFYRFPNIYYIGADNNIYRVGNFKRRIPPKLSNGRIVNNDDVSIQAVGKDPNTERIIEDVEVGKYIDGQFVFNRELSPIDISNLTSKFVREKPGILSGLMGKTQTFINEIFDRGNEKS